METQSVLSSVVGGALIGIAVTLMLLFNGRVTGISGIIASSLSKPHADSFWRWLFVAGLLSGGLIMHHLNPGLFANNSDTGNLLIISAGLLVGYGTVMAGGCTSGHGICGLSRFSIRSLVATLTFMLFGFFAVQTVRYFSGGSL